MAKDIYHETVKTALVAAGWQITDDPLRVAISRRLAYIDLGAKNVLTASRDGREIAVEIKSFVGASLLDDMYGAVGQYTLYRPALARRIDVPPLYLALSTVAWKLIREEQLNTFFDELSVRLLIFNPANQQIEQWIE